MQNVCLGRIHRTVRLINFWNGNKIEKSVISTATMYICSSCHSIFTVYGGVRTVSPDPMIVTVKKGIVRPKMLKTHEAANATGIHQPTTPLKLY
jgi:hypothetical protein